MLAWRSIDLVHLVADHDDDCGGKDIDKDGNNNNNGANDDNRVICCWRGPLTVTLLVVVYKSCSQSPFASTSIGFDLIGSNFYTNPHLPPPHYSLYQKRAIPKWKWENWGFSARLVLVLWTFTRWDRRCRERGDRTFSSRVLNCKTSRKGPALVWRQNLMR